ncbi:AAA family ATPase [Gordonia terrae]|uniref:AAA family ATPase n=2 Tax=Gordonia terrae TaxID=2055 RepID=A0AAD0P0F8_9ACTN|nr:AAA family ATPase [Gordonia terrae]VTR10858.1 Uncharacterised protein [Clostridioides difficile]ANY24401.1 hypothetical protein BCM27_17785 [Gordonia terrae]AWO85149.1 hypothetical protein DLJ61_17980 [Gordonia terrae]VTS58804.1 Uncharacterised protein [Gordonia terrae]GAB46781.1 hypothetical protein GOTRE_181_00600 [Gordonia terrae NBRC 100016]
MNDSKRIVEMRGAKARAERQAEANAKALKFVDENLLTRRQVRDLPTPRWIVSEWLVAQTLASVFGEPGVGKSAVVLDMALCVATGRPWNGRATLPGRVVYLVGEGLTGMEQRISAWEAENNGGREVSGLYLFRASLPLIDGDPRTDALVEKMATIRPSVIVVDTQARYTVGLEENSATDQGKFVDYLDDLAEASGSCILVVRHAARGTSHARGSTALEGAVETEIHVDRDKRKADTLGTITLTKQKNGPDGMSAEFAMVAAHGSVVVKVGGDVPRKFVGGDPFASPRIVTPRDSHARRLAWICWVNWREATTGFTRDNARKALQDSPLRIRRDSFYKAWSRLERDEYVEAVTGSSRFKVTEKCIDTEGFTQDMASEYERQEAYLTPESEASDADE